ncbi:hypothetical protein PYCCODRAFT_1104163 [Trametes coccinea BRFM310]|uniref:Uncharacterized protein n=1 Tax=Trametes coccinea (strain BRFM310) TaxID=1353009 RepID=A0A1Y2I9J5_TRAC3|nr:hypothetical protein PYCCODRAFT_1104163 [Trametes coccinea BRFM310]
MRFTPASGNPSAAGPAPLQDYAEDSFGFLWQPPWPEEHSVGIATQTNTEDVTVSLTAMILSPSAQLSTMSLQISEMSGHQTTSQPYYVRAPTGYQSTQSGRVHSPLSEPTPWDRPTTQLNPTTLDLQTLLFSHPQTLPLSHPQNLLFNHPEPPPSLLSDLSLHPQPQSGFNWPVDFSHSLPSQQTWLTL